MSELTDEMNNNAGVVNYYAQIAAIQQRKGLEEKQKEQIAAIKEQTAALLSQNAVLAEKNRIDQARMALEQERTATDKKRLEAAECDRNDARIQSEKVRHLRLLMVNSLESIKQLKRRFPTS